MNRDEACLRAILKEIVSIPQITRGYNEDKFLKSEKTQKAICMTLLNIGELVKGISEDLKTKHNEVAWKNIAGLRDITAHKYHALNMGRVWVTVQQDLPVLKTQIIYILKNEYSKDSNG